MGNPRGWGPVQGASLGSSCLPLLRIGVTRHPHPPPASGTRAGALRPSGRTGHRPALPSGTAPLDPPRPPGLWPGHERAAGRSTPTSLHRTRTLTGRPSWEAATLQEACALAMDLVPRSLCPLREESVRNRPPPCPGMLTPFPPPETEPAPFRSPPLPPHPPPGPSSWPGVGAWCTWVSLQPCVLQRHPKASVSWDSKPWRQLGCGATEGLLGTGQSPPVDT